MDTLVVRLAELKDAEGIAKIHVQTWQCAYAGHMPDSYLNSLSIEKRTKRWKENLLKPEDNATTFVAELENKIVGFCSVSHCRDEDMPPQTGELWAIYVDANYMRQGVGSTLLQKGLEHLRKKEYKKATLWVLTSNTKTRTWYESKGWVLEGKVKTENSQGFELHETRYIIDL